MIWVGLRTPTLISFNKSNPPIFGRPNGPSPLPKPFQPRHRPNFFTKPSPNSIYTMLLATTFTSAQIHWRSEFVLNEQSDKSSPSFWSSTVIPWNNSGRYWNSSSRSPLRLFIQEENPSIFSSGWLVQSGMTDAQNPSMKFAPFVRPEISQAESKFKPMTER